MDENAFEPLLSQLSRTRLPYVIVACGAATQAIARLLQLPASSSHLLEVIQPQHASALVDYQRSEPAAGRSFSISQAAAAFAHRRASQLTRQGEVSGLSCFWAGPHTPFEITTQTRVGQSTWTGSLSSARSPAEKHQMIERVFLNALADAQEIRVRLPISWRDDESLTLEAYPTSHLLDALYRRKCATLCGLIDGRLQADAARPRLIVPGSFNPLHEGHLKLAEAARLHVGQEIDFEISIDNVDKPTLSCDEVLRRRKQFLYRFPVWLTRAASFREKVQLFPGATFVVGFDTAVRLLDKQYHNHSDDQLRDTLEIILKAECRFLVGGRVNSSGSFCTAADLDVPTRYTPLFAGLSENEFRLDLSSTAIRSEK